MDKKELLFIYLEGCPYCQKASHALEGIFAEHPEYKKIPLVRVSETKI